MAKHGLGATVSIAATALAEVTNIGVPERSADVIEVTSHDSTDGHREYIRGLRDAGEITITMLYVAGSASDDACIAAVDSDDVVAVEIVAKAATGTEDITFNALATGYKPNALKPGEAQTATLTLKPTGAVGQAATV